jgi:pimeloyl-ACP methyl ester carboxylesterase
VTEAGPVTLDRGSGPPVLLLHGQPGEGASWLPVTERLVRGYRVLAPDRPGYGATVEGAMGMAANADVLAALLRQRGAAPAVVVGHSWAGGVAILMAIRHPDVVRGLVLAGSVGTPDSVNGLDRLLITRGLGPVLTVAGLAGIGVLLPRLRSALVGGTGPGRSRRAGYLAASLPDEALPGGWAGTLGRSRRTFLSEQRALMAELPALVDHLADVGVPTTVVAGEWDVVVPPSAARTLADAIPGARLVRLPRVGHFLARDAPDEMAEVIRSVVAGADLARGVRR